MPLVGNTFFQPSSQDPGPGTPMFYWHQTDNGRIYIRNTEDTAWVFVGNSDVETLNLLSRDGGWMNGAIGGASELLKMAGGDSTGQLQLSGSDYALKKYMDAQATEAWKEISTSITSSIAGAPTFNASARFARAKGIWKVHAYDTNLIIPLPTYSDGVQALEEECVWLAGLSSFFFGNYTSGNFTSFKLKESSNRHYMIDAVRSNVVTIGTSDPIISGVPPLTFRVNDWDAYGNWEIIGFRSR